MEQADKLQQLFNEIIELQQQFTLSKNPHLLQQIRAKRTELLQQVEKFKLSVSELQLPVFDKNFNSQEILPNFIK